MSPFYLLIFLLFASVTVVLSTPIALFFNATAFKNDSKLALKSHAVILTEQYVLSTKFPLLLYNLSDLCVIPREQILEKDKINSSAHFCQDLNRTREADDYDLCVTELQKPFIFTYRVEVAPLPALKKFLIGHGVQLDFLQDCAALLNLRYDTDPNNFPYGTNLADFEEPPYTRLSGTETERTEVYLIIKKEMGFCDSDNSMPVYCNHVVIGLFRLNEEAKDKSECANKKELTYVNLINPVAQFFLKDFYETGPWPSTIAPNTTENMTFASSTTPVPPK